jgi:1-deoxy-D-xylulose-5-phosphate synthase
MLRAVEESGFAITVEENTLTGGFGSAVLECVNAAGLPTDRIKCLGIPDRFIEHGERDELLADLGLDVDGLVAAAQAMAEYQPAAQARIL